MPVFAKELHCIDALMLLLENALFPNLIRTQSGTPALVHAGPFANIAHGCNSLIATKTALSLADYVVTECGFAADLGFEKFCDIKVPLLGKVPDCVVIVTNIRDLKYHGAYCNQTIDFLENGIKNLEHHINIIKSYGLSYVVAVNSFANDSEQDNKLLTSWLLGNNHPFAFHTAFKDINGAKDLALIVAEQASKENVFHSLINPTMTIEEKIEILATKLYNANEVKYLKKAREMLTFIKNNGFNYYPICVAKTHLSICHDASVLNVPSNYIFEIDDLQISNGAGFIVILTKGIVRLPGLNSEPRALNMNFKERKL
jgi:formate--tetrahydrofolate ligase